MKKKILALVLIICVWPWLFAHAQDEQPIVFTNQELQEIANFVPNRHIDEISGFSEGLASFVIRGKHGFIDESGKVVIPAQFRKCGSFSEGWCNVVLEDKHYAYIDKTGKVCLSSYLTDEGLFSDYAGPFEEGSAIVNQGRKWGLIDKTGKELYPIVINERPEFHEGLARIVNVEDRKTMFIDRKGSVVIPEKPYIIDDFQEGLAKFRINDRGSLSDWRYGFIDKTGKEVIPAKYESRSGNFSGGLAAVELNDKMGYIDKRGNEVIPCIYDEAYRFEGDYALVKNKMEGSLFGKYEGMIDKTGKEVVPLIYTDFEFYRALNLVSALKDGKWGIVDLSGKIVMPFVYERISRANLTEKLFLVKKNGKWGVVDLSGKIIMPFVYDDISYATNDLFLVKKNGKWGVISKSGKEILPYNYDDISYDYDDKSHLALFYICKDEKWGVATIDGQIKIQPSHEKEYFSDLKIFGNGVASLFNEGGATLTDSNGHEIKIQLDPLTMLYVGEAMEQFSNIAGRTPEQRREDLKLAISWFTKAAEAGELNACFKLALYYYNGIGFKKDYQEAVKWSEKSFNIKDNNGNNYLVAGHCYYLGGNGVEKDQQKALQYYLEGSKYDNESCQNALAVCYLYGQGCEINVQKACEYADILYRKNKEQYANIYGDCYNHQAYEYLKKNDLNTALEMIEKSIDANPNDPLFYDSKGEFLMRMGKTDEALKTWEKIISLNPRFFDDYPEGTDFYNMLKQKGLLSE